ncbi:MAG: tRNA uridine-5-carboxymethylaminomethyl(34) synthesis enzyme MnmG [Phycisphaera sp.]|nr:tRNA uridine-5-carboxymethylaminomethyl(34) synthesis enzyme MnmG [Phycisphaera sp.]
MSEAMRFDVIVIGGGHAGLEAAWAAAGAIASDGRTPRVALVTMDPTRIGTMSCNPAIGGLAKGQMVREIDALGGLMGGIADATGIMFKMLNMSRGAAVRGPRCQNDKEAYRLEAQRRLSGREGIEVIAGTVGELLVQGDGMDRVVRGIRVPAGGGVVPATAGGYPGRSDVPWSSSIELHADAVVLTTGTFMRALMHVGDERTEGGRIGEGSAVGIAAMLRDLDFELGRLKTGTPPRLSRASLDWDSLPVQAGDERPVPFSDLTDRRRFPVLEQVECRITSTNGVIHDLIRANLDRAPMYSGAIDAESGPRYCPSIEDKVVRFADRESHHVFLEPETIGGDSIYCNGISTSLPQEIQIDFVRSMSGCERAEMLKPGYAVEYDMVPPHQIDATCETKRVAGLFLAGQINGTSGYEEAAAQGLLAGLNAARRSLGRDLVRLGREQAYIGVMMDDLVTRTPREPYRMFTSRAEHRLRLRHDNADERLTPLGRELGLVDDGRWAAWEDRSSRLERMRAAFDGTRVDGRTLSELCRRPETTAESLREHLSSAVFDGHDDPIVDRVLNDRRYAAFVKRADTEIRRQKAAEHAEIPEDLDPGGISGLRSEAIEVLRRFRPRTLGQAGRLAGVNPADVTLLQVAMRRHRSEDRSGR